MGTQKRANRHTMKFKRMKWEGPGESQAGGEWPVRQSEGPRENHPTPVQGEGRGDGLRGGVWEVVL